MAEYIERDKIFSVWRSMPAPASVTSLSAAIHQTPTIDIVRRKDCAFYRETKDWDGNKYYACHKRAAVLIMQMKPDDFCSYGERRTDG